MKNIDLGARNSGLSFPLNGQISVLYPPDSRNFCFQRSFITWDPAFYCRSLPQEGQIIREFCGGTQMSLEVRRINSEIVQKIFR